MEGELSFKLYNWSYDLKSDLAIYSNCTKVWTVIGGLHVKSKSKMDITHFRTQSECQSKFKDGMQQFLFLQVFHKEVDQFMILLILK